jgi:hypothetical protein
MSGMELEPGDVDAQCVSVIAMRTYHTYSCRHGMRLEQSYLGMNVARGCKDLGAGTQVT